MLGRSWYRFSLRSLLVACAVCCAALAVWRWCFAPDPILVELESLGCRCTAGSLEGSSRLRATDVLDIDVALPRSQDADAARINQLLRQLPILRCLTIDDGVTALKSHSGVRDPRIDKQGALVLDGIEIERLNCSRHAGLETAKAISKTKRLGYVHFRSCPPDSLIEALVQNHSLRSVHLPDAEISTLALLSRERTLGSLRLDEPKLDGLFALETLPALELLETLPYSVYIGLSLATLDDDSLLTLSRLSFPFRLRAYGSKFSDEGLAAFETAQTPLLQIDMNSPHVTDLGLSRLSRVRDLEVVNFDPLSATESGIIELLNAGKEIHIHSLSQGQRFDIDEVRRRCPEAKIEANGPGFDLLPPAR